MVDYRAVTVGLLGKSRETMGNIVKIRVISVANGGRSQLFSLKTGQSHLKRAITEQFTVKLGKSHAYRCNAGTSRRKRVVFLG